MTAPIQSPVRRVPVRPTHPRRRTSGFTLIELLVAIAILGILGTVVIRAVWGNIDEARQTGTKTKATTLADIVTQYRRKHNDLPNDLTVLTETDPMHNNEPWVAEEDLLDAWNRPFTLIKGEKASQFEVVSFGANGEQDGYTADFGVDRDISSNRPLDQPQDQ